MTTLTELGNEIFTDEFGSTYNAGPAILSEEKRKLSGGLGLHHSEDLNPDPSEESQGLGRGNCYNLG